MLKEAENKRIGVLYGGWSSEREVSLRSGRNVFDALLRLGYKNTVLLDVKRTLADDIQKEGIEVAVVMLHGSPGEDGTIQGLLEVMGVPYTGSGVIASAIGIDKFTTKHVLRSLDIPSPDSVFIYKDANVESAIAKVEKRFEYPVIVKPRKEGSSVGVEIVRNREALKDILEKDVAQFGDVLVERYIEGKSVTVGILGTGENAFCVPSLELRVKGREFYDYVAKYTEGYTEFVIPADIPEGSENRLREYALKFYRTIGGRGVSRVDAVVDGDGNVYILEINTIPGMTGLSDLPKEAEKMGVSYDEVVEYILKSAFE